MAMLFDFSCEAGHTSEELVNSDVRHITCPQCGLQAARIVSPVRSQLDPISGHFPGETMKWARDRQQKIQQERKLTGE